MSIRSLSLFSIHSFIQTNFFLASYLINLLELDLLSVCLFSIITIDWRQKKKAIERVRGLEKKKEKEEKY
jgi:hypothetical protein